MDLTNVDDLRIAMQLAGLKANKGLGQHFLIDRESLDAVLAAGELRPDDTVLEIGPGLGVLTMPLTRSVANVIAVEMDATLAELLSKNNLANLSVRHEDIMKLDFRQLPSTYKVVANIPYYLTSAIMRLFMEAPHKPELMSVLIQKEVAERIVAEPGQMSVLAFSVQYYGRPTITAIVGRHKFWPAPKVDSAVLQVKLYSEPVFAADRDILFRLVKAGFGEKRKMLKNSLAGGLNITMETAMQILRRAGLEQTVRAQELSVKDWGRLYRGARELRVWG